MKKKEFADRLHSAIGEIDDELIIEANEPSRSINLTRFYKPALAVAALLLVCVVAIAMIKNLMPSVGLDGGAGGDQMNGNASPPPDSGNGSAKDVLYVNGASLELINRTSNTYTFKLIITERQDRIDVTLRGEGTDEWGEHIFVISTTAPFAELTHIAKAPPKITVNGESASEIPTLPGEYILTVDLSALDPSYTWRNYFTISPFGNIFR